MKTDERRRFNRELLTIAVPLALQNLLNALVGASDALDARKAHTGCDRGGFVYEPDQFCNSFIAFRMLCISMARDHCLFCHVPRRNRKNTVYPAPV